MTLAKPFIKWVGGKGQLLDEIRQKYPSRIEKYCEPFVGGGAVLFDVLQKSHPDKEKGVTAKAVGCSALRSRSFLHFVSERLRRCFIA